MVNKAKTTLVVLFAIAISAGVSAFNATRGLNVFYSNGTTLTTTTPGGPQVTRTYCTVVFTTTYTTTVNPITFSTTTTWSTTSLSTRTCPTITVYQTL
ncbi:conserved hypothetical protein [Chitinophaga pinensis DSM 2588]|uniref:Uncharacterized protein n=1 Tax=Chitinophaga pinensis (strain ATCC 43595 / DSM 2588 / LMG 13176 / NBRC 15968 / NCIMB 11800 / UQM 2034) TaxID=485918 RepID=A0A979G4J4_CHIPD|nr:conserved hypothetical protein [Chitinophaga pinensis DSM 2588]